MGDKTLFEAETFERSSASPKVSMPNERSTITCP